MQQVMRWIEEYAWATFGLDAKAGDVAAAANTEEAKLAELFGAKVAVGPSEEAIKQIVALRALGRNGRNMSQTQFTEAMTTAHFSYYFADAISRAFYADYAYSQGAWNDYTYKDMTPDFRDVDRFRMTEPEGLDLRREKAEPKATYVVESEIHYGVEEYARQFDVSWRVIVNDDLGKIRETPSRMANAARRWLDAWVSALYDNATTQAGLNALGATYAGTGRLTAANLAIGLNAMMQHVDALGNPMNISAVWLVIPKVLEIQASVILQSALMAGTPNNDQNVLPRFIRGVRVDPYIGFTAPNVPWYLVADPSEIPTITVARLSGWPGPVVSQKRSDIQILSGAAPAAFTMGSFATGDIEFMVEDIVGGWDNAIYVGVTDPRGIYWSSGTTP